MRYEECERARSGVEAAEVDQILRALPRRGHVSGRYGLRRLSLVRDVDGVAGVGLRYDVAVGVFLRKVDLAIRQREIGGGFCGGARRRVAREDQIAVLHDIVVGVGIGFGRLYGDGPVHQIDILDRPSRGFRHDRHAGDVAGGERDHRGLVQPSDDLPGQLEREIVFFVVRARRKRCRTKDCSDRDGQCASKNSFHISLFINNHFQNIRKYTKKQRLSANDDRLFHPEE